MLELQFKGKEFVYNHHDRAVHPLEPDTRQGLWGELGKHLPLFEDHPPRPDDLTESNPKPLKALVQKRWCSREKFESRLLGPTQSIPSSRPSLDDQRDGHTYRLYA
jgi:hypothetical protein